VFYARDKALNTLISAIVNRDGQLKVFQRDLADIPDGYRRLRDVCLSETKASARDPGFQVGASLCRLDIWYGPDLL
jgi:hypothetical protein